MLPKKLLILVVMVLLLGLGFVFYKYKTKAPESRGYTNEKVTELTSTLPQGFPSIPVYPELSLDKSYQREQNGKTDFSAFWYYSFDEGQIPGVMKWYVEELKKANWKVEGPFIDEGENELSITAENSKFKIRIYNSERYEGDSAGRPGKIISATVIEK